VKMGSCCGNTNTNHLAFQADAFNSFFKHTADTGEVSLFSPKYTATSSNNETMMSPLGTSCYNSNVQSPDATLQLKSRDKKKAFRGIKPVRTMLLKDLIKAHVMSNDKEIQFDSHDESFSSA